MPSTSPRANSLYESENAPVIWRLSDTRMTRPVMSWLTPRVATNEWTLSLTTTKPESAPTAPQAARAASAPTPAGSEVSTPIQLVITRARPITAPMDRS
jgi:hypothetical protein